MELSLELAAKRIRRGVGYDTDNTSAMPDLEAQELIDEAEESYSSDPSIIAQSIIIYLEGVLAGSAKMTTYRQNNTTQNSSDIFPHVKQLLDYWNGKLLTAEALISDSGNVRSGKQMQLPTRMKEYPDS